MRKNYALNGHVYVSDQFSDSFKYSDGDDKENYLSELIKNASDLTIGSQELLAGVIDWPSLYHLSPKRADLLRPISDILKGKLILEIGSGCGAITRYLGELPGTRITALEGSYRRASITQSRCRDLDNIKVICDNFQDFEIEEKFDIITLIGVLEYSNLFIDADNPPEAMLKRVYSLLKPEGHLIIAIENKLGLKYLAGAPEDHLNEPYFGIENRYTHSTVATFGKMELIKLLEDSGFNHSSFYYPFPDYKLPNVVLTETGVKAHPLFASELLTEKVEYFQNNTYTNNFSTSLAVESFSQNGLLSHFSNSFLVVTNPDKLDSITDPAVLAYSYSTYRRKKFCKENIFEQDDRGQIMVIKKRIYDQGNDPLLPIGQIIENEAYYEGILHFKLLISLIARTGWTLQELSAWSASYYDILCKFAFNRDNQLLIEGKYIDLTPFNIVLMNGGKDFQIFDQEWICAEDLPLYYVFFRGLRFSLGAISFFNMPSEGTPHNLLELCISATYPSIDFTAEMLEDCLEKERKYFTSVNFTAIDSFESGNIRIRGGEPLEEKMRIENESLKIETERLRLHLEETLLLIESEKEKFRSLEKEKDWYIRTYEQRNLLGIIRDRMRF